jgi:predicted nucleic acid-binding protein
VRVVVADTGPLNYLLLIGQIDLLPRLFDTVTIPDAVRDELADEDAPRIVREWVSNRPSWLSIKPTPRVTRPLPKLDPGEQAALALALELKAELVLMDDRAATRAARELGFTVTGTLGILGLAAANGLVDLQAALACLTRTNFHVRAELIEALLAKYRPPFGE